MILSLDEIGLKHGTDKASNGHDYLKVYEKILPDAPIILMEIGWFDGASMKTWREYLHMDSVIFGVDINSKRGIKGVHFINADATKYDLVNYMVQDEIFPDVIIDDGSHLSPDVIASFQHLWPILAPGGYYIIEDLHVSYHKDWKGWDPSAPRAVRSAAPLSSMEFLKRLTDDVHFHHAGAGPAGATYRDIDSIAFHPGLAVIRKAEAPAQ